MIRFFTGFLLAGLWLVGLVAASPVRAGEEILYEPAPGWIDTATLPSERSARTGNLLIYDQQFRIERGRLWKYTDIAVHIGSPQELSQAGTITATWLPDKGDFLVHEISIIRDGTVIDIVAEGGRLEILRREQELEQRMLDGMLTATLAVPGLQVGDALRFRSSSTLSDQALGDEVQNVTFLPRKPHFRAGFARVKGSWPDGAGVRWRAMRDVDIADPVVKDGYAWLEVLLPLDKADDVPFDAPQRYHLPAMLQVGSFSDWQEVSRVMAPYYAWDGAIAPGSELADRVAHIRRAHSGELERAVAALVLVQDEIAYLANGLNGGNYIPQAPAETWTFRYGDCKAKTLLLLALLGELGIEAEAVTVTLAGGDALPEVLPMLGAFNHVIVRARIDGNSYWFDGTGTGANVRLAGNVPPVRYGLPLREHGADLEAIEQVLPRVPDAVVEVDFDQTAGVDLPVLYRATVELSGMAASMLNAARVTASEDELYDVMHDLMYQTIGASQVTTFEFVEGKDHSELTLLVEGLMTATPNFDGARVEQRVNLPGNSIAFAPDRARRQWRDTPVLVNGPEATDVTLRYRLPNGGEGFTLEGPTDLDQDAVRAHQRRSAALDGGMLTIRERVDFRGGEVAPGDVAAVKREAASLERNRLVLVAPKDIPRRWQFAGNADRSPLAGIEAAYARQVEREPDEVEHLVNRALFRELTFDFRGALADYDAAIDLQADADLYATRARVLLQLDRAEDAVEDAHEAWALDPKPGRAMWLAHVMGLAGDVDEAILLLDEQDGDEETRRWLEVERAELESIAGRAEAGYERIEQLLADRPNDPELLNAKCWYMGVWNFAVDESVQVCTRAVEVAAVPGPVLDSRALAYLRVGELDKALSDANAALSTWPEQHETLLLRGLIRLESGDEGGRDDVRQALAREPALAGEYTRYGFNLRH